MSRNTTTNVPAVAATEGTTPAPWVGNLATVVADYQAGRVGKKEAAAYADSQLHAALGSGDMAQAVAAGQVITALRDASRTVTRDPKVWDLKAHVDATLVRIMAVRDIMSDLSCGEVVPADVPADQREAFVAALEGVFSTPDALADYQARVTADGDLVGAYEAAAKVARSAASVRVIGQADIARHLAAVRDGRATDSLGRPVPAATKGTFYTFAKVASFRTDEYPEGTAQRPSGAIAARFVKGGKATGATVEGFTFRQADGTHGQGVSFQG